MFWLNFYQIAYIAKLIVFLSLYRLLFPVALEQNLTLSKEYLLIFTFLLFRKKWKYIRVKSKYINAMCTTCTIVGQTTIQGKTEIG